MKILVIVHVYPPEHAPAGVMVSELALDLTKAGHSVTILTGWPHHPRGVLFDGWKSRWRDAQEVDGVRLVRCGHSIRPSGRISTRLWYYFTFAVSTFINGLREDSCDVVFCLSTPMFGSWSARFMACIKRARFVYGIYDLHPESALNAGMIKKSSLAYKLWRWQDTLLCRHCHAIITLSKQLKKAICERQVSPEFVSVIPLWIDSARIEPGDRLNKWRHKHNISDDTFVALYAGTIGHISGVEILLKAAEHLKVHSDIQILCVGDGVAKEDLMRNAKIKGIENLIFLPFQDENLLADMQATADVGLVTLLPEAGDTSVPSKVLGYMAAGRAVIASVANESATALMLCEAECGIVTLPCDGKALADAIIKLYNNRSLCHQLGDAARAYTINKFSRTKNIKAYENLFQDVSK